MLPQLCTQARFSSDARTHVATTAPAVMFARLPSGRHTSSGMQVAPGFAGSQGTPSTNCWSGKKRPHTASLGHERASQPSMMQ